MTTQNEFQALNFVNFSLVLVSVDDPSHDIYNDGKFLDDVVSIVEATKDQLAQVLIAKHEISLDIF